MPDISMCSSDNCPMKDKCYRSTATASKYQVGVTSSIHVMKIVGIQILC